MQRPNYTQIYNEFIDSMYELTGEEVKIFIAISRKTIGWRKDVDKISYSQLKKITGIRHHVTIKKAIESLQKRGFVSVLGDEFSGYSYDLSMSSGDIVDKKSMSSGDIELCHGVTQLDLETMSRRDTTKEKRYINKKENKNSDAFETIWKIYPRRINKAGAFKAFSARISEGESLDVLTLATENYARHCAKTKKEMQFILHGSTFFGSNKRYEDYKTIPNEQGKFDKSAQEASDEYHKKNDSAYARLEALQNG